MHKLKIVDAEAGADKDVSVDVGKVLSACSCSKRSIREPSTAKKHRALRISQFRASAMRRRGPWKPSNSLSFVLVAPYEGWGLGVRVRKRKTITGEEKPE
jgi:hypothetical protein